MSNTEKALSILQGGNMPAFIHSVDAKALNREAAGGTGGGESPNRISIKNSRFRLIVGGEQVKVFKESHLDIVILRANPEASKVFFAGEYDPNAEDKMPDCWSDNGIHPSPNVDSPVSRWCKNCPKNAWGSAISRVSGKKIKACDDRKRLAIVPEAGINADAFQLSLPGASLKEFAGYLTKLDSVTPSVPYNGVVTRISFDDEADYPRILFEPVRFLTDEEYQSVSARFDGEEAKTVATITDITDPPPANLQPAAEAGSPAPQVDEEAQAAAAAAKEAAEREAAEKAAAAAKEAAEREAAEKAKAAAAAAWGGADEKEPATKPQRRTKATKEAPPVQHHEQADVAVSTSGKPDVESLFEGWDD